MPEKRTIERARKDKREGKSATTQAGEFVREEIRKIRRGQHGARSGGYTSSQARAAEHRVARGDVAPGQKRRSPAGRRITICRGAQRGAHEGSRGPLRCRTEGRSNESASRAR